MKLVYNRCVGSAPEKSMGFSSFDPEVFIYKEKV